MGKINVLSFAVANLIAAGEVVDRPASVIKELMENAIDAGSTRITVEIQNGGVTFMRVSDNGCGMSAEDLPIAVRRHATSKIRDAEDLDGILTLGFRGEALAAIASVSHIRIFSKPHDAPMGAMLESVGGENVSLTEIGCSDGTTVIVEDLFANVPARRKFLKKDATEAMAVTANVEKVALSRPDIAFRLIVDGNVRLETAGNGDLRHTVYAVFGKDFASRLIEIDTREEGGIRVSGYIGRPDNVKANRNFQNYFINGRYVKSKTACAAVEQAYCSYMPPEKFPCCVLNLQINPAAVDVNVHPAKLEVKFSNEKPVFEAIYYAVRNALEQDKQRPDIKLNQGHISVEEARRLFAETAPTHKPRVSDATVPIREGRAESLKRQQIKMEIPATTVRPTRAPAQVAQTVQAPPAREMPQSVTEPPKPFRATLSVAEEEKASIPSISKPIADEPQTVCETVPVAAKSEDSGEVAPVSKNTADSAPTPEEMLARYIKECMDGQPLTQEDIDEDNYPLPPELAEEQAGAAPYVTTPAEVSEKTPDKPREIEPPHYRIIGEVWNAYILLECEDKLLLIDQHAAHERIIFEQFKAAMQEREPLSQMLMIPVAFEFSSGDAQIIADFRDEIEAIGFVYDIEDKMICVHGIPCGIEITAVEDIFATIAERIRTETGSAQLTRDILFEKALYQASCKAAIKAGRAYASEHIAWICDRLMRIPDITVCPHGRPVAMTLSRANLDRQFKRT
jgi:DNA mismatch repair protein MutL